MPLIATRTVQTEVAYALASLACKALSALFSVECRADSCCRGRRVSAACLGAVSARANMSAHGSFLCEEKNKEEAGPVEIERAKAEEDVK